MSEIQIESNHATKRRGPAMELAEIAGGQQCILEWVHKAKLLCDHSYQRELSNNKAKNIAKEWNWVAFGVLMIALRDQQYFVIDGQHRHAAAMLRNDIDLLPCAIFMLDDIRDEACGFFLSNRNRSMPKSYDLHRSHVMMGNPDALLLQKLCDENGISITDGNKNNSIRAIGAAMKCMKDGKQAFSECFPLVVRIHGGRSIIGEIMEGIWYLWRATNGEINKNPYLARLLNAGPEEIMRNINAARSFYTKGGARIYADGICNMLNKGLSKNKITVFNKE